MKNPWIAVLAAFSAVTTACGGSGEGERLKGTAPDQIKNAIQYSTDHDGKRIAVEGYVTFSTAKLENGIARLELSDKPVEGGEALLSFEIKEGQGKNTIAFGETSNARSGGYRTTVSDVKMENVRIHDSQGNAHPLTQKIRLSGDIKYIKGMDGKYTSMPAFEKGKTQYNFDFRNVRVDVAR